jgi:hypothetical protein
MKQIIWSSDALLDETAREYYQNFKREELDDDAYKVSDEEWSDEVYNELGDERQNLNKDVNGVIIAFGDLGLWNGRKQGYQILGDNIAGILQSTQYDAEWDGAGCDMRGRMSHDDALRHAPGSAIRGRTAHHARTNHVLPRAAENRDDAEQIAAKIYNYEIDENGFRQVTRSLHPYVAAVYGWKTLQDNLVQVKSL